MMLRHALDPLFEPRSLLLIADRALPVMKSLPASMLTRVTVVNCVFNQQIEIPGLLNGVAADDRVDLVLVCVPPSIIPEVLTAIAPRRPRSVILLPHEVVDAFPERTGEICRRWAAAQGCALLGPNAGVQRPRAGLNLSQHPSLARHGRLAVVSQSRAIAAALIDWAEDAHLGFSSMVALGDEAVTRLHQALDYLASDPRTDSIVLYLEEIELGREFMSALRAAASVKPVIVLKVGRGKDTSLADAAFDAALRRAGAVRVRYFLQMFSALKVLSYSRRPQGRRLAILANGSGPPQMAFDMIEGGAAYIIQAELSPETRRMLGKLLEPGSAPVNPVITKQALTPGLIRSLLECLVEDPAIDGVLVLLTPDARADMDGVTTQLVQMAPRARKPVITCFMGDADMRPLRRRLDDAGAASFRTPESAAYGFGALASYHYNQQMLLQMQPPEPVDALPNLAEAKSLLARIRAEGRETLKMSEVTELFAAFHIPLKVDADDEGYDVSHVVPMAVSVARDRRFGPLIRFGAGGPAAKLMELDEAMDLPPLNRFLARRLVERSRIWRVMLAGHMTPNVYENLLFSLEKISDLVTELPDVEHIRIDPMFASNRSLFAGQVQVSLTAGPQTAYPQATGYMHMAIHPYPYHWVEHKQFEDGRKWTLRPIRPEDAQSLQAFIRNLSDRSRYMRFVSLMRELTPRMLARYTQIDYHRELALVATTLEPNPANRGLPVETVIGLAHYLRHPDGRGAEYALVIGDNWQRRKLGAQLMGKLIEAAAEQGLEYIDGMVLADNKPMLGLMTSLGLTNDPDPEDPSMRRVWLRINQG